MDKRLCCALYVLFAQPVFPKVARARGNVQYTTDKIGVTAPFVHAFARILCWCHLRRVHGWPLALVALLGSSLRPIRLPFRYGVRALFHCGTVHMLRTVAHLRMGRLSKVGLK